MLLQFYIYLRISQNEVELEQLGISIGAILVSISFSVLHGMIEISVMYMEAKGSKTDFFEYMLACFTGRFEWIPFLHTFESNDKPAVVNFDKFGL